MPGSTFHVVDTMVTNFYVVIDTIMLISLRKHLGQLDLARQVAAGGSAGSLLLETDAGLPRRAIVCELDVVRNGCPRRIGRTISELILVS